MMPGIEAFLEAAFWSAATATGFAVLFHVPHRSLPWVALLGALGYCLRFAWLAHGGSIVPGTLLASLTIGVGSMVLSYFIHSPAVVYSMPAVIPMVPGTYAYKTMIGLMQIADNGATLDVLIKTVNNGLITGFILVVLAIGVSVPNLLLRGKSIREIRWLSAKKSDSPPI